MLLDDHPSSALATLREMERRQCALIDRVALTFMSSVEGGAPAATMMTRETGQNPIWREKVMEWYSAVLPALDLHYNGTAGTASSSSSGVPNPYRRASIHHAAALLDDYILSLPPASRRQYRVDQRAYQLLATTGLLLGMRLSWHDQCRAQTLRRQQRGVQMREETQEIQHGDFERPLKRTKRHRGNMNEIHETAIPPPTKEPADLDNSGGSVAVSPAAKSASSGRNDACGAVVSAAALLQISAATKLLITEEDVLQMAKQMIKSKVFPRSKRATALDFIEAFLHDAATNTAAASSTASSTAPAAHAGVATASTDAAATMRRSANPAVAREALRLADASVRDVEIATFRPSVIACSILTVALMTASYSASSYSYLNPPDEATLRRCVCQSVVGKKAAENPATLEAVKTVEARLRGADNARSTLYPRVIPQYEG